MNNKKDEIYYARYGTYKCRLEGQYFTDRCTRGDIVLQSEK